MIQDIHDETGIIEQCRRGDVIAFEKLFRHYQAPVYRYALRMLKIAEDAEDAVQLSFMRLHRGIKGFRAEARLSTYLFRIVINVCNELLQKRKPMTTINEADWTPTTRPQVDIKMQLEESIRLLPLRMRQCFVLFAVEGFRQHEIADMLDISAGTVKAHVSQAKEKLRKLLSDVQTSAIKINGPN